ncbi:T9SS type A sorting domain-containing protein [bacterium]|nr:T9SS type A sorting domain-containing protein [bacterium]MBU1636150.1 T9SS type A sorting domain-containing protein [bacterium]
MANLSRFVFSIFTLFLLTTTAPAQLVPLVLEETITLPVNNMVWDVIPHSDGYYCYLQAAETSDNTTTIFIGRTDQTGSAEFTTTGQQPRFLQGFYYEHDRAPTIYLENYYSEPDSTQIRVIDLETGFTLIEKIFRIGGAWGAYPMYVPRTSNLHTDCVFPFSAPPLITHKLTVSLIYQCHWTTDWLNVHTSGEYFAAVFFPSILLFPDSVLWDYSDEDFNDPAIARAERSDICLMNEEVFFSKCTSSSAGGRDHGVDFLDYRCGIACCKIADSASCDTYHSIAWDPRDFEFHSCCEAIISTFDSFIQCSHTAAIWESELNGLFPSDCGLENWVVSQRYSRLFAADIVDNDGREEILGYRDNLDALHVYRWQDGYRYGQTSEIVPNPDRIAIIGRYSDEYRRLALQYDNQLYLYSFSEYLDADPIQPDRVHHEAIRLSSSPQPAVDQVQFRLSTPLNKVSNLLIYDLLGREVSRNMLGPQSTSVLLNLSTLPSGVYFAVLDGQPQAAPHKFILLK